VAESIIVDSHCHASPQWYEPVETLLFQMDRGGVSQAVLVQLLGQFENSYQAKCCKRYPGRFVSVAAVDTEAPDALETVANLAASGATGLRLRPTVRSHGDNALAIWRAAAKHKLAISCVGPAAAMCEPGFLEIVEQLPELSIVLEHLGGLARPDVGDVQKMRKAIFGLARFPNVYFKVPGLGQLSPRIARIPPSGGRPLETPNPAILMEAVEKFGPSRLMWGSDFPPVASREGYRNALEWVREALRDLPGFAQDQIFGGVARHVFRLPNPGN
jgi:L-fuconolactonase